MIWANLLHLSYNMWEDRDSPDLREHRAAKPFLRFDANLWDHLLHKMVKVGMNTVLIDLGDGVQYESHPEIAVKNAWSVKQLKGELERIRKLGLDPIPKLNFSTSHDAWLGEYARCVSTDRYYAVCRDLIAEAIDIFDKPRFLHLGMDEETAGHQRNHAYVVIRQHELWWHDLYYYIEQVERDGVRAWVWSDYLWRHPQSFFAKMPKSVLQSNWYYGATLSKRTQRVAAYLDLEQHGFDQVPAGSNSLSDDNFRRTVAYCSHRIAAQRLLGFLQTPWTPTLENFRQHHLDAIDQVGAVIDT